MIETERIKDGVKEHRHTTNTYWHPAARIHNGKLRVPTNPCKFMWKIGDIDDVTEVIEVMHDQQLYYVDLYGDQVDLPAVGELYKSIPCGSPDDEGWAKEVSKIDWITTIAKYHRGDIVSTRLDSRFGYVVIEGDYMTFEEGSPIHDARLLINVGLAEKYIPYPDLSDAMHVLHVSDPNTYDLIFLPSGGHVPPQILERDYGVSWETLAKIPLGKPRDCETFTCPICGQRSYFTGICEECEEEGDDQTFNEAEERRIARKEAEHGEILRLIKSDNWKNCRYMRG